MFTAGMKIQIVLQEVNLKHGAAEVYPHLATGEIRSAPDRERFVEVKLDKRIILGNGRKIDSVRVLDWLLTSV